jgi:predicted transposase/invertase (TIGR01784 family)
VQAELDGYESSLKTFRDNKAVYDYAMDTAFDEGKQAGILAGIQEGKLEGKLDTAKSFKKLGVAIETIIEATGLTKEEIEKL